MGLASQYKVDGMCDGLWAILFPLLAVLPQGSPALLEERLCPAVSNSGSHLALLSGQLLSTAAAIDNKEGECSGREGVADFGCVQVVLLPVFVRFMSERGALAVGVFFGAFHVSTHASRVQV